MNAVLFDRHENNERYALCWALSLLLHGAAVGAAVMLTAHLRLAPQPNPFRWDVSLVGAQHSPEAADALVASTESIAPQAAPPPPAAGAPTSPLRPRRPAFNPTKTSRAAASEPPVVAARPQAESPVQAVHSPSQNLPTPIAPSDSTPSVETFQPAPSSDAFTHTDVPQPATPDTAGPSPGSRPTLYTQYAVPSQAPHAPTAPIQDATPSPAPDTQTVARLPENASSASTGIPDTGSSPSFSNALPQSQTGRPSPAMIGKPDFGWLATSLRNKVLESQKYSTVARLNGMEGRVILRITVKENGELLVAVAKSSGHELLDKEAVKQVQNLSPFPLTQPLGRTQQVLNLPIIYSLNQ